MNNILAYLVPVCNYTDDNVSNLPFCRNDVIEFENVLKENLNVDDHNIISLKEHEKVTRENFLRNLNYISNNSDNYDTVIFYFTGHGTSINGKNYLALSDTASDLIQDTTISIDYVLDKLKNSNAKNKILIIDSCNSGIHLGKNFSNNVDITLEEELSEGWSILASCKGNESSWLYESKSMSVFSYYLCNAFNGIGIKKEKISLEEIRKYVTNEVARWARENNKSQTPNLKGERVGTVYFTLKQKQEKQSVDMLGENEEYKFIDLEDVSHSGAKRNSAKLVLVNNVKDKFDIYRIISKAIEQVKDMNLYKNKQIQNYWGDKQADIVWLYIAKDIEDIRHANWCYTAQWVNKDLDDKYKIMPWDDSDKIDNIEIKNNSMYEMIKQSIKKYTSVDKEKMLNQLNEFVDKMTNYSNTIIEYYNEFLNEKLTEEDLFNKVTPIANLISNTFVETSDMDFVPVEIESYDKACHNLFSTTMDFSLYYNKANMKTWTAKNRKWLMENTEKRYNEDLKRVNRELENLMNGCLIDFK